MNRDLKFTELFDSYFLKINRELTGNLSTRVPLIEEIGRHSLLGPGKRLRPLLFVLSAQMCGYEDEDIYRLSTIFEYIHTASLLHDDVLDNAELRRRKPSVNQVWGNSAAVLEGDFLYSKSMGIAVECRNLDFLRLLTETTTKMAEGQVLELIHTHDWHLSKEKYMEIIASKTAVLISAACACGAVLAGGEKRVVKRLGNFGLNMGVAFQLIDDLLDYTSSEEVFGKPVGKDLREGKITLPLIYTLEELGEREVERISKRFKGNLAAEEDYMEVISRVRKNGAIEKVRSEAEFFSGKAFGILDLFEDGLMKQGLALLNSYILERSF